MVVSFCDALLAKATDPDSSSKFTCESFGLSEIATSKQEMLSSARASGASVVAPACVFVHGSWKFENSDYRKL